MYTLQQHQPIYFELKSKLFQNLRKIETQEIF